MASDTQKSPLQSIEWLSALSSSAADQNYNTSDHAQDPFEGLEPFGEETKVIQQELDQEVLHTSADKHHHPEEHWSQRLEGLASRSYSLHRRSVSEPPLGMPDHDLLYVEPLTITPFFHAPVTFHRNGLELGQSPQYSRKTDRRGKRAHVSPKDIFPRKKQKGIAQVTTSPTQFNHQQYISPSSFECGLSNYSSTPVSGPAPALVPSINQSFDSCNVMDPRLHQCEEARNGLPTMWSTQPGNHSNAFQISRHDLQAVIKEAVKEVLYETDLVYCGPSSDHRTAVTKQHYLH